MALPTVGPAVAFTVADIATGDDSTIELVALVGKVTGAFSRELGGVRVVLDGENTIERRAYSPPLTPTAGLIDFHSDPLYWSTSATPANMIGGQYEFYATVKVTRTSRPDEERLVRLPFVTDEQAVYSLDGNGRIPFEQVYVDA